MIDFGCPKCGTNLRVADNAAGQKLPCPKCGQRLKVPEPVEMRTMAGVLPAQKPAAVASGKQWYCQQDGKPRGPLSWTELKNMVGTGALTAEDRVWAEGMADWKPGGAVPNLFPKRAKPPTTGSEESSAGKWFEGLGVLLFGATMGLAFLVFIGFIVWKGVRKTTSQDTPAVATATLAPTTAPAANSPAPPAGSDDPPPQSSDGPSGAVTEPQVWEMVQINTRGDGMFLRKYRFPVNLYPRLKAAFTDTKVLRRALGFRQHWHEIKDFHIEFEDEASALVIRWTRLGLARQGDKQLWEAPVAEETGLTPAASSSQGSEVVFTGKKVDDDFIDAPLTRVVRAPRGSTDMQFLSGTTRVGFRMASAAGGRRSGDSSPSFVLQAQPRVMACLGQIYARPKFARWWIARSVFKNAGSQTLRDYVVRFRLEDYVSKWQESSCPSVVPGQVVVDAYFPILDLRKLVELSGDRKVRLEVEYQYRQADGQEVRKSETRTVQLLGRNQVVYSNLPSAECLDREDHFQNVTCILAAMATKDDKLIEEMAGRVARSVGGANASSDPLEALKFMGGLYRFMSTHIRYQTPAGDLFEGEGSQTVMYGRDVLKKRAGTCIDLAILYASACEAVGLESQLIIIPGHCYPVVRLPAALTITKADKKKIVTRYFGVETTMIGNASFDAAWNKRTVELPEHREHREGGSYIYRVDVRQEQGRGVRPLPFPAVSLKDIGIND